MRTREALNCFLWCVGLSYVWSFASLYFQIPGLFGDSGVLPVRSLLRCSAADVGECAFWGRRPSGLHLLVRAFDLDPAGAMELAALLGLLLSSAVVVFPCARDSLVLGLLWYLHLSCFQVGQTFLWFQWDTLLLEVGALAAVAAPLRLLRGAGTLPQDRIGLFLVKWLALRMMFASGVVKLSSECPTWWGLTALHHHFQTQCIPTPLAWLAQQSPDWLKRLSVAGTFVIEMFIPPLFLLPIRHIRRFAYYSQVLFMIAIAATGNYNFFNFLYATICLPLLADSNEDTNFSTQLIRRWTPTLHTIVKGFAIGVVYGALAYWSIHLFNIRLDEGWRVLSEVAFSKEDFYASVSVTTQLLILVGAITLVSEISAALVRCWTDVGGLARQTFAVLSTGLMSVAAVGLFAASLVPFTYIDESSAQSLLPEVKEIHDGLERWQVVHSYGLFRSMTGVGGRPEVVLEMSSGEAGPWTELEFLYKPGALNRSPPWVAPHQPRLDWQMWFAALGDYRQNPWLLSLVHRLLLQDPAVLRLVTGRSTLRHSAPKLIRAQLYHYEFTAKDPQAWWQRKLSGEYMPAMNASDANLIKYLSQNGMIVAAGKEKAHPWLGSLLQTCRGLAETMNGAEFVWAITAAVLLAFFAKRIIHS